MANTMIHPGFPLAAEGDRVATLVAGFDGTNAQIIHLTSAGDLILGAGSAILGSVKIDQTTPGTTNGVVVNSGTVTTVSTVSAITAGNVTPVPLATSGAAASTYHPITQVTKASVKGSAGNVFKFRATNENAAVRYIQLHNKATAPAATDVPVLSWKIPAGTATTPGYVEFEFVYGEAFATGIGIAVSTTQATFTDSATASEHELFVEYK